ncbi:hypothetical protein [Terasakiella pusilla]|jgi:hypothetical protein|uniref:hypothetical protein n=1 Tax=Terasakiella pusilla TaxID=64973 RepID=UPI0012EC5E02|nr:hypothetical protein [Terasakiella pusilla]
MEATPTPKNAPENQTEQGKETPHDQLIFEEQYAGVAFMFDQMDKLATTEHSL